MKKMVSAWVALWVASAIFHPGTVFAKQDNQAETALKTGWMYLDGKGVQPDDSKAAENFLVAAKLGNAEAQWRIGWHCSVGRGVPQDHDEALKWFLKAAEQGHVIAQSNLGAMYYNGQGVTQDYAEALKWFKKAAEQGYGNAQGILGYMYANDQGVPRDNAEALKWYRKAAEQGDAEARAAVIRMSSPVPAITSSGTTTLFGITLRNATRADLRSAIRRQGAKVLSEENKKRTDAYGTADLLSGTSELVVFYTFDDHFAVAKYTFPGLTDNRLADKVREMVEGKYGAPAESTGSVELGPITHRWVLKDGITISVNQGWRDATTYLEYTEPENQKRMASELDVQTKKANENRSLRENPAF